MKKGGKKPRRDNIDDFLEQALGKPSGKRPSKPLVRSNFPKDPVAIEAKNTMIKLDENESMFAKLEERKRAKEIAREMIAPPLAPRVLPQNEEPEELYEEDFEAEEVPTQGKKMGRVSTPLITSQKKSKEEAKIPLSLEEINKIVEQDTKEARRREEEENLALQRKLQPPAPQMVVQRSNAAAPRQLEQKTKKTQEKRNLELQEILQFESVSEGLFDLQSMNEYDDMMRKLQQHEVQHSSTQWNDDYLEREAQTVEIETADKQLQWPEDMTAIHTSVPGSINKFLRKVLPVVEDLLEENNGMKASKLKLEGEQSTLKYVASVVTCDPLIDLCAQRFPGAESKVTAVAFFPVKTSWVAVATTLGNGSLIYIWDLQIKKPVKFLEASSLVTSLCIPASSENVVICGTSIGSLLLWDLREDNSLHTTITVNSQQYVLRQATYSTEGISEDAHSAAVERVVELEKSSNRNFQVVSVDSSGVLISWSIIEMPVADAAGSEFYLGLRVGGRMKLVLGSSISVPDAFNLAENECSALAFDPSNSQL